MLTTLLLYALIFAAGWATGRSLWPRAWPWIRAKWTELDV